jgi:hypothetical protein
MTMVSAVSAPASALRALASDAPVALPPWPSGTYRRLLTDMHVPDWDPAFLASYDPVD